MRRSNVIYYSINDADKILIQDFSNFNNYFDIPVTFGGSLNSNGEPFRFYKGTISAMKIRVYDEQ